MVGAMMNHSNEEYNDESVIIALQFYPFMDLDCMTDKLLSQTALFGVMIPKILRHSRTGTLHFMHVGGNVDAGGDTKINDFIWVRRVKTLFCCSRIQL